MEALLDQRHMTGPTILQSQAEIRAFWERKAAEEGFRMRQIRGDDSRDFRRSDEVLTAYVNDGRWVADCRVCNGGVAAGPRFEEGICLGCGTIYPLKHPPPADVELAEAILAVRPPSRRGWRPSIETVDHLAAENEAHGYMTDAEKAQTELERIAAESGLKISTVERVLRAEEKLGRIGQVPS